MSMYGKYAGKKGPLKPEEWPVTDFTGDLGFTVQADRDDADINVIINRFQRSGQLPPTLRGEPFYGDVSEFGDLQESLIKIQEANELFQSYPPELRERFDNDPVKLVDFLGDVKNREEAIKLGLIQAPPVAPPADSGGPGTPAKPV